MDNYLVVLFLISKIFYIGNVIGQLFLLNLVLATKYQTFGYDVLKDLIKSRDWTEESYVAFPRVTLCDFKVGEHRNCNASLTSGITYLHSKLPSVFLKIQALFEAIIFCLLCVYFFLFSPFVLDIHD